MATRLKDYSAWEEHRDLIYTLHIVENRTQDEVLEMLKNPPYGLDATTAQFERILADILKISKNLKGEDWMAIDYHKGKRKRQDGKETIVYVNGVAQNSKKIQRQANRYRNRTSADCVGSPLLPPSVSLRTPPRSPGLNSDLAMSESCIRRVEREPIMGAPHPQFNMEPTITDAFPDLMDFEFPSTNEPAAVNEVPIYPEFSEIQMNGNWFDWNIEPDWSNSIVPLQAGSMIVIDRYSNLLNPSPWFEFADWLTPKLESLLRPRSSPFNISDHSNSTGVAELPVVLRAVMGLSKIQSVELQKAEQFVSCVIPERFEGELKAKIDDFGNPAQAKIQAAELLLSLFANNHKTISIWDHAEKLRKWIMEIPIALLEMILQRKDPTAAAITSSLLEWSIKRGYSDVFQQLLKANLDKTHLTGKQGGRLLIKALSIGSTGKDISSQILKCKPSPNTFTTYNRTPLHLAAMHHDPELLKALVDQGIGLTARDKDDDTPFDLAVLVGKLDNVSWFLENGVPFESLDSLFKRMNFVPNFEMCNMLWEKYPKKYSRLIIYILIFSAVSGPDEFAKKVDEISRHYDDVTPILEEALCITMKLFHTDEFADEFRQYYSTLHSDDYNESDYDNEEYPTLAEGDVLDVFLEYGVDPNAKSVKDWPSPIISAIKFWTLEEVKALLDYGATLDQRQVMNVLLLKPNLKATFEIMKYIFLDGKAQMKMTRRLSNGRYPLQAVCAIHKGREEIGIVKYFIENGADVNSRVSAEENYTALHFAVEHGQLETIRYLIKNGAKVRGWLKPPSESLFELCVKKCPHECGWEAPRYNNEEELVERVAIWELLLEICAETDDSSSPIEFNFGDSLANAMKTWPNSKLVDVLMRTVKETSGSVLLSGSWRGETQGPFSPLQLAVRQRDLKTVKILLKKGANVNEAAGRRNGGTALQIAIIQLNPTDWVNLELVTYLLDNGASVNACGATESGKTALQEACARSPLNYELIRLLLERGADVNGPAAEVSGRTALQVACLREEVDFGLVNLLIENGADINAEAASTRGITALQGAVIHGNIELVVYLLERGANANAAGARVNGRTAIEAAAEHGRLTIAQILLNANEVVGGTLHLDNAIALAKKEGHFGVVKLLEDFLKSRVTGSG